MDREREGGKKRKKGRKGKGNINRKERTRTIERNLELKVNGNYVRIYSAM